MYFLISIMNNAKDIYGTVPALTIQKPSGVSPAVSHETFMSQRSRRARVTNLLKFQLTFNG